MDRTVDHSDDAPTAADWEGPAVGREAEHSVGVVSEGHIRMEDTVVPALRYEDHARSLGNAEGSVAYPGARNDEGSGEISSDGASYTNDLDVSSSVDPVLMERVVRVEYVVEDSGAAVGAKNDKLYVSQDVASDSGDESTSDEAASVALLLHEHTGASEESTGDVSTSPLETHSGDSETAGREASSERAADVSWTHSVDASVGRASPSSWTPAETSTLDRDLDPSYRHPFPPEAKPPARPSQYTLSAMMSETREKREERREKDLSWL